MVSGCPFEAAAVWRDDRQVTRSFRAVDTSRTCTNPAMTPTMNRAVIGVPS